MLSLGTEVTMKLKEGKIDAKVLGIKSRLKGRKELFFNLTIWKTFAKTSVSATNQWMKQMCLSSFHLYLISILLTAGCTTVHSFLLLVLASL